MGGTNLEIFKFGMYIMFPIAWMYYFGTNLDERFSVPDFWPKAEATQRIPFEKAEIREELDRLRRERLWKRQQRLAEGGDDANQTGRLASISTTGRQLAGGPLDNSAAAAVDSVRNTVGGMAAWLGR